MILRIADRIDNLLRRDGISRPALLLVAGRTLGFAAAFAIPVVLTRVFDRAAFGTYKQLFLVYTTLYGLAQVGAAECLYYFVPRRPEEAAPSVANAVATLAMMGSACFALLYVTRGSIADWLSNPALASYVPYIGIFLALTLTSAAFEIVMVSRKDNRIAAAAYAASDVVRTALFVVPALAFGSLRAVLIGAALFAVARVVAMLGYFWREFGGAFRLDFGLWRVQLAYALPFAVAVGIDVVQANIHSWVVASRFDAATFAIYAVGCLQIPLVDLVCTSTGNVMMVKMAEGGEGSADALALWHNTTARLASLMFPLAAILLLTAPQIIVLLFTRTYAASVPVFMVWCLMILPSAFAVDAVLRAYAQTRFLLVMNIARLLVIVALIGWFLTHAGLIGAVLVTLVGTSVVKAAAMIRIARLMHVGVRAVLPWKRLATVAAHAAAAAVPPWIVARVLPLHPLAALVLCSALYGATYFGIWAVRLGAQQLRLRNSQFAIDSLLPNP